MISTVYSAFPKCWGKKHTIVLHGWDSNLRLPRSNAHVSTTTPPWYTLKWTVQNTDSIRTLLYSAPLHGSPWRFTMPFWSISSQKRVCVQREKHIKIPKQHTSHFNLISSPHSVILTKNPTESLSFLSILVSMDHRWIFCQNSEIWPGL